MGFLFFPDPKTKGCGKKRVAEWFGLRNAAKSAYPKSAVTLSVFFALLESASVKAALGMLMKLTNPGSNAIKKIYS